MPDRTSSPQVAWPDVEHYLGAGQAAAFPLAPAGSRPRVSYVVEHGGRDIALHVELLGRDRAPAAALPAIRIDQIFDDGRRYARIRTTDPSLVRDFHDFLCAIAGRIVAHGRNLQQAYAETVRAWSTLLDKPRALSQEKRLGLLGELAVLKAVSAEYGWLSGIEAWTGPDSEQSDFALPGFDLEVKCTASEQRRHTIHGATQLTATPGRPLWFTSIQLTRGGADGRTLTECVHAVRAEIAEHAPSAVDRFNRQLAQGGWSGNTSDDERWTPRSAPLLLESTGLPRLDLSLLPAATRERISSISYAIDVTDMQASPQPPLALTDFRLP